MPEECPVCGSPVERDGPLHFCLGGLRCPAQLKGAVEHYTGEDGLDIEGIGERAAEQFVEAGLVERDVADLYELTVEDIAALEGWGQKSAEKVHSQLHAKTEPDLATFLAAIGIPEVGPTVARTLAGHFGSLDAIVEAEADALQAVEDVGPIVAQHVREFFETNRTVIERLRERGVEPQTAAETDGSELDGLTVVVTGSVEGWTRDELTDLVESHGGSVTGSVSGNTDYLVVGANPGTTKREDAEENDVPQIDPDDFFDELAERGVAVEFEE